MPLRFFPSHPMQRPLTAFTATVTACLMAGCAVVERTGIAMLYQKTTLPEAQIHRDLPYGPDLRHRLNLFLPTGPRNFPTAIFVHGGSWTSGSKDLLVGGADVYGNIGRFLATRGIATAVINYRLQPAATWQDQIADVARATAWVHANIKSYGGNPHYLSLAGHSAGAQLAAFTALHPNTLTTAGMPRSALRGIIAVSGAGLDLTDSETYALGHSPDYYRSIIEPQKLNPQWQRDGSATTFITPASPPFLVIIGGSEEKPMQRQSERLRDALSAQAVPNTFLRVPRQGHARIVLAMSRPDQQPGPNIVDFIKSTSR